ncbi:ABC transporter permease, partial [uncultured Alistipes sp.]|uniref:ABC transporter permease n=1 Tax=uncultured Alistipes sp. TaxID=538949 RepID=UPI00262E313C
MAQSKIGIIIAREFNERVRKKSFIVTTILMPILMIGLMVAPALIMRYSRGETRLITVIDRSGLIAPQLESGEEIVFNTTDLTLDEARRDLTDQFGILWIGEDVMTNPNNVKLYTNGSSSMLAEESVSGQIADIIEKEKLKAYNIENLSQILEQVETTVYMQVFRNDRMLEGEDEQATSSSVATAVGFILAMILYMFLVVYGAMVMQSVIEEKNNRVLEVVVSSISPFQLMLAKILGVASVAVGQELIWGVLV